MAEFASKYETLLLRRERSRLHVTLNRPQVKNALNPTLIGELRAVFDLLWYQGMSQAEAAALLGVAVPTVKLRWMKARLQVQQALDGSPFDEPGPPD